MTTEARFTTSGRLTDLRIDPGTRAGSIDIDWIRLIHQDVHPLVVTTVAQHDNQVEFTVANDSNESVSFSAGDQQYTLASQQSRIITRAASDPQSLQAVSLKLQCEAWPPIERTVWILRDVQPSSDDAHWLQRPLGKATISIARDGSVALIHQASRLVASLGPLALIDGHRPAPRLANETDSIRFESDETIVQLTLENNELAIDIESNQPCEGPIVRVYGGLEQGLFAGLEYLGKKRTQLISAGYRDT